MSFDFTRAEARNASRVFEQLLSMPHAAIEALQRGVARVAARMLYRGRTPRNGSDDHDAVDVLVKGLLAHWTGQTIVPVVNTHKPGSSS